MEEKLLNLLKRFHKRLENNPLSAVKTYQDIADSLKKSPEMTLLEDCAEVLAYYIKEASVWKARAFEEAVQRLPLTSRLLIARHFTDFFTSGISLVNLLSTQEIHLFGRNISLFRKSKMPEKALVFGDDSLTPLDFEFTEAFHSQNHTIFWRRFTGEVWACGRSQNFLKESLGSGYNDAPFYSTPIKLIDIVLNDTKEGPLIKVSSDFTIFENYTSERSLFIGAPPRMFKFIKSNPLEIWEQGENYMVFTRKGDLLRNQKTSINIQFNGRKVKVQCQNGSWWCAEIGKRGTMINYFCGKRVPKMRDLTICENGTVWYLDKDTLYKGSLELSDHSEHGLQLICSMLEVPFMYRIGGFSISPAGTSGIIYPNTKNQHIEELHPRHQMDYSMFMLLTYDPWATYFSDFSRATCKLDDTETWLIEKLPECFNEYGFIKDELETLTAINHLYDLIKVPEGQRLPEMMQALDGWGDDKLAPLVIVQYYLQKVLEEENLRILIENQDPNQSILEQVIQRAQSLYSHKISVIREGLKLLLDLQYPKGHEGIWIYVKFMEFIGYYRNRSLGSKGRFETKPHIPTYFQNRDLERIVKRRLEQGNLDVEDEERILKSLVKVQAIGNRSDKTKMDNFYMYPCILYVFRTFLEALDPSLLEHINKDNFLDLNLVCHNDRDNKRFVWYIRELTGCDHPRDFEGYFSRISLLQLSASFSENYTIKTSDKTLLVPKLIFQIFSSDNFKEISKSKLERIQIPQISGSLLKLAIEALLDVRELLRVSTRKKYKIYQLYHNLRFMEAVADVIKLIVITGSESDVQVFRAIFHSHPLEISQNIAKYRPEILIFWGNLPVPEPRLQNLEQITQIILAKRYQKLENSSSSRPKIMSDEQMFGLKMGEEWLLKVFTDNENDKGEDLQRKFWQFVDEENAILDFATA